MKKATTLALLTVSALALAACGGQDDKPPIPPQEDVGPTPAPPLAGGLAPGAVNSATFAAPPSADQRTPAVLRAQVLLDRAKFSPGVIDGTAGENLRQAVAAFEEAKGLPVDGELDEAVFTALTSGDGRPVLGDYVITEEDVKGPFVTLGDKMTEQAKLPAMGFESPKEALAEKFHMTEELLDQLNPGVDFAKAGTKIVVAQPGDDRLPADVALIEVDKADKALRAYDAGGKLLAFYPATIGSDERPAPEGLLTVTGVAQDPTYTFDPKRLTYSQPGVKGKLTLPPGPNSPVGSVWIALSKETFGIHGSDAPKEIGKKFSHGCIRLTNWDAEELASKVKSGVKVSFIEVSAGGLREQQAKTAPKSKT
ncbi:L,D-transpeptidase family protein [Caulobacter sp. SLTY]|uniref:L,D-transpeptidase family protein n=1 Tax=Caulobacter sp. SLTY TaxID=2683262 RepID=UPI00141370EF|nr:L,D-transpeptidase [Caulobacter sp. SLTY]NBB16010.1 L,D-transpeptidase family protein [Caulobacter sp. SLTY]